MTRRELFEIQPRSLQDNAGAARVERIWRRIESNVGSPIVRKPGRSLGWAPALVAGLAAGFVVGHQFSSAPVEVPGKLVAEPPQIEAAGTREPPRTSRGQAETPKTDAKLAEQARHRVQRVVPLEEPGDAPELSEVPIIETQVVQTAPRAPEAPALWLQLADRGEYQRAYHSLEEHGGFDSVLYSASADELMILADVARATGSRGRAIQALRRVTESFVSDPNAPIAAMTLGRMLMQAGDRKGASDAFSLYRRLSPEGDFAEDALASDIQAAVEEGNWERAQTLAKQYESDFPDGRHLEQIREQLKSMPQAPGSVAEATPTAPEAPEPEPQPVLPLPESPY